MSECGLCHTEIPLEETHYSSMQDGKYIDVCPKCAGKEGTGETTNSTPDPPPARENEPIPASVEEPKTAESSAKKSKERAMTEENKPEPQAEIKIQVETVPGKYGKLYRLLDPYGNKIELKGSKAVVKLAKALLKRAQEK